MRRRLLLLVVTACVLVGPAGAAPNGRASSTRLTSAAATEVMPKYQWIHELRTITLAADPFAPGWKIGSGSDIKWIQLNGSALGTVNGAGITGAQWKYVEGTGECNSIPSDPLPQTCTGPGWLLFLSPSSAGTASGFTNPADLKNPPGWLVDEWNWLQSNHIHLVSLDDAHCFSTITNKWQSCGYPFYAAYYPPDDLPLTIDRTEFFTSQPYSICTDWANEATGAGLTGFADPCGSGSNPDNVNVAISADNPVLPPGGTTEEFRIVVSNPQPYPVTVSTIRAALASPFTYTRGSTEGYTTADPINSNGVLAWALDAKIEAGASISLSFGTGVASDAPAGDYQATATAVTSGSYSADTSVEIGVQPHVDVEVAPDEPHVLPGDAVGFTVTLRNTGTGPAIVDQAVAILPAGFSYEDSSTRGYVSSDPTVDGQQLTWPVRAGLVEGSAVSFHFVTDASELQNDYTLEVDASGNAPFATGTTAISVDSELLVALMFRPHLLFDSHEVWRPVAVDSLLAEQVGVRSAHRICTGSVCSDIRSTGELRNGTTLDIRGDQRTIAHEPSDQVDSRYSSPSAAECGAVALGIRDCDSGPTAAIYYNRTLVPGSTPSETREYWDYWYFFRYNHSGWSVCRGPHSPSCFEHEGDWEGVTVATKRVDHQRTVDWVGYAQHENVWRYDGGALLSAGHLDGSHPRVYVADGTHSGYPSPCASNPIGTCPQEVALADHIIPRLDGSHDGRNAWAENDDGVCGTSCVRALPESDVNPLTQPAGNAADWNAWTGTWGAACSSLVPRCERTGSPTSPGQHPRYNDPAGVAGFGRLPAAAGTGRRAAAGAQGCASWFGPSVVALACNASSLERSLSSGATGRPTVRLFVDQPGAGAGSRTGIAQVLGTPLRNRESVAVRTSGARGTLWLRVATGSRTVAARFSLVRLGSGSFHVRVEAQGSRTLITLQRPDGTRVSPLSVFEPAS